MQCLLECTLLRGFPYRYISHVRLLLAKLKQSSIVAGMSMSQENAPEFQRMPTCKNVEDDPLGAERWMHSSSPDTNNEEWILSQVKRSQKQASPRRGYRLGVVVNPKYFENKHHTKRRTLNEIEIYFVAPVRPACWMYHN